MHTPADCKWAIQQVENLRYGGAWTRSSVSKSRTKRRTFPAVQILDLQFSNMTTASKSISVPPVVFPIGILLLTSIIGVTMVVLRVAWTKDINYLFLIWNLFLAWLPVYFALKVRNRYRAGLGGWRIYALAGLWLLFLPNAPYIFTDLVHLENWFHRHYWTDLCLILQFGFTGAMLGFVSLYLMQAIVVHRFGRIMGWLFVLVSIGLSGVGVWVGRFLRLNSWDIVTRPLSIFRLLGTVVLHPIDTHHALPFSILFATFLLLGYLMVYALTHLRPMYEPGEPFGGGN